MRSSSDYLPEIYHKAQPADIIEPDLKNLHKFISTAETNVSLK